MRDGPVVVQAGGPGTYSANVNILFGFINPPFCCFILRKKITTKKLCIF